MAGWDAAVRVLCVDDHQLLIEGLKAQFGIDGSISVVGSLGSTERVQEEIARTSPDVVLMDIELPGPDAFETADRIHRMFPKVRVVFLSAHIRDGYVAAAFKCGAWGYFAKSDNLDSIVSGIHEVAKSSRGAFVTGPKVRARCFAQGAEPALGEARPQANQQPAPPTRLASLSTREIEVLRLIGKGLSRKQIGVQLCRSAKTIDGHQERMMRKLGITSRSELMRFAIHEGLAEA